MARASILYADRSVPAARAHGFDPDTPIEGFYRMRLRSGGVFVGIRIWHGPPKDPVTGEIMDRSWRWQAEANGEPIDLDRVWPACAGNAVDQAEHDHLAGLQAWGRDNGHAAFADPRKPIDLLSAPLPF